MRSSLVAVLLCCVAATLSPTAAPAVGEARTSGDMIALDLDNVSVKYVAKLISDLTEKNITVTKEACERNITFNCPEKIPLGRLIETFRSVLEANGMTLTPSGSILKVDVKR